MAISNAVPASAVARVLGIDVKFVDRRGSRALLLPQRVMLVGQGASASTYDTTKRTVTSATEVGQTYGFGSPLHLAALELLPANGDGLGTVPLTVYPLEDDDAGVAATGDITPAGTQTVAAVYRVVISEVQSAQFVINVGDTVADITAAITEAVNATVSMPVIAVDNGTDVGLTSKWQGVSANALFVEVVGSTDAGTTFAITQPAGGAGNPEVDAALGQVGNVWETMGLCCLNTSDSTALNTVQTFGEGRWGPLVRKPLVMFWGNTDTEPATAITIPDNRKTDRINSQLVAPASNELPFVVAARQLARIAVLANNNPPHDYGSQDASGLVPGPDGDQWDYLERDLAVKGGSSTIEVKDGVINVSDVVTFYHPTGEEPPAYRYVVDIVKLQNCIFNYDIRFATPEYDGAPLLPDDQPTANRTTKKPKTFRAEAASVTDGLGLEAILVDTTVTKANTVFEIDSGNPKRVNGVVPITLSGNTNIISLDLEFGFLFGTPTVIS